MELNDVKKHLSNAMILKMRDTEPGHFAVVIDKLLYNGDTETSDTGRKVFRTCATVSVLDSTEGTETLLRNIRDYLECIALAEATR